MKRLFLLLALSSAILSCTKETCDDGIENQDETDIDCGGECAPCPTCTDGIKNQNETEIDCGGICGGVCYPDNGAYGVNILNMNTTTFTSGVDYSLHATMPLTGIVQAKFQLEGPDFATTERWSWVAGTDQNLSIDDYDESTGGQEFMSNGMGNIELKMIFTGTGSATVSIYEGGWPTPVRVKYISWN